MPRELVTTISRFSSSAKGSRPSTAAADVLSRVNCQLAAAKLASEIKTATARISELVGAIKEYSYMDQAKVQELDVHKGLDNTLLILKYKLKKKDIKDHIV